ncbi:MAG: hypothetical protein R3C52_15490 [Hyphomonadaceae bacterium]
MTSTATTLGAKLSALKARWGDKVEIVSADKARFAYGLLGKIALVAFFALVILGACLLAVRKECVLPQDEYRYAEEIRTFTAPLFASSEGFEACHLDRLHFQLPEDSRIMGPALMAALMGLVGLVGTLTLAGRRKTFYAGADDARPYALYLRTFKSDLANASGVGDVRGEAETAAVAAFWPVGPSIALDNVDAAGVSNGAVRIKTDHAVWRDVVRDLGSDAAMYFMDASNVSLSLRDEIDYLFTENPDVGRKGVVFILGDVAARASVANFIAGVARNTGRSMDEIDPEAPPAVLFVDGETIRPVPCREKVARVKHLESVLKSDVAKAFFASLSRA